MGTVITKLVLDENGNITGSSISQGVSEELNDEVLRVIASAPAWEIQKPMKKQEVLIPVSFRIHDKTKNQKLNSKVLPNEIKVIAYNREADPIKKLSY
ncbi:energy transducer TonB [Belliella sp. DSM 111904]|uniref:Energy transducer TonB n=2 Tax=Belliella filtrata TaxID=2923435 RepID=A0ABS9V4L6_9BACT|nr:energy transducer TonB [Belliella filtrata]